MSFKAHVLQGVPYEDVKVVKESEKVWESLFKNNIERNGAKDKLSKGLEPVLEYFCKHIQKQHERLGGDFAVAWCSITRAHRDFCKKILRSKLVFICLEMDNKILKERLLKRHPENEKTANFLLRISDFSEPALDGELNVHTVDNDSKTTTAQCARSVILLEKWGVKTFISSMQL